MQLDFYTNPLFQKQVNIHKDLQMHGKNIEELCLLWDLDPLRPMLPIFIENYEIFSQDILNTS